MRARNLIIAFGALAGVFAILRCTPSPSAQMNAAGSPEEIGDAALRLIDEGTRADRKTREKLIAGLSSSDPTTRYWCCRALASACVGSSDAIPALEQLVIARDENPAVRAAALLALNAMR